jgi:hypothetical protein
MSQQVSPLEYQPASRSRRSHKRLALLLAMLLVMAIAYGLSGKPSMQVLWRRVGQMRVDRALMNYDPPAGQVVWDDTGGKVVSIPGPAKAPFGASTGVFTHARRTAGGTEYLVIIDLVQPRSGHGEHLAFTLIEPTTLTQWQRHFGPDVAYEAPPIAGGGPKKIFAGRLDPQDESHFTIDYIVNGTPRVLDGWIIDIPMASNGSKAALKMNDRPAAAAAAAP